MQANMTSTEQVDVALVRVRREGRAGAPRDREERSVEPARCARHTSQRAPAAANSVMARCPEQEEPESAEPDGQPCQRHHQQHPVMRRLGVELLLQLVQEVLRGRGAAQGCASVTRMTRVGEPREGASGRR